MELNGLARKRETHLSVVNVWVHSLLVTLRNDGVGVSPPDGGQRGLVVKPREESWLTAVPRSTTRSTPRSVGRSYSALQRHLLVITCTVYADTVKNDDVRAGYVPLACHHFNNHKNSRISSLSSRDIIPLRFCFIHSIQNI